MKKAFPTKVDGAPLVASTVLLNRYTTTYRAIYAIGEDKQAVVDINEQTWMQLTQEQIRRHVEGKVKVAR